MGWDLVLVYLGVSSSGNVVNILKGVDLGFNFTVADCLLFGFEAFQRIVFCFKADVRKVKIGE